MWTRRGLKMRAKDVLRTNYWKAFLVSLVILFAVGGSTGISWKTSADEINNNGGIFYNLDPVFIISVVLIALVAAALALLIAFAFKIFVANPLEVGGRKYFVQSAQYIENRGCFRFAFHSANYRNIVKTMFLRDLFTFLWSLLFIIPGIIKFYSYRMVPYILADNPNIGASRAIQLSKDMTYGHKWKMLVLDLSFIGWYLLGLLCAGIGTLFVNPYAYATEAELYLVLRQIAVETNMCTCGELLLRDASSDNGGNI